MADTPSAIAVIGVGKMGEAILRGWIASDRPPADKLAGSSFTAVAPREERRSRLEREYGVPCVASVDEIRAADMVLLAVKPQVMPSVLNDMQENPVFSGGANGPLFVSIAAGLSTDWFRDRLPIGSRVVRVMPNMPLMAGVGASGVCGGSSALPGDAALVESLFACLGQAAAVEEREMDAVCALSGSGPAYVAAMVEALRDAACAHGLDRALAERLALQTVYGTAVVMKEQGVDPASLRESVCSPGGTTLAALDAMESAGFADVFRAGVDAAVRRSRELASC